MRLLQMSLSGGILILTVAVLRAVAMDRLPKRIFPALWALALARLLIPATLSLPGGRVPSLGTIGRETQKISGAVLSVLTEGGGAAVPAAPDRGPRLPAEFLLWIVPAAVLALILIVSWLRCRREFRTSLPVEDAFVARWLREHPLRRKVEVRELTGLSTPLTYGVVKPVILMPKATDWSSHRQVRYMLFHEYTHIRRFDNLMKALAAAALCVHWFNPLVWLMAALINRDLELACDECLIRHFGGGERKSYAMTLLSMEERRGAAAPFGSYFSKNATEERINAIMKANKNSLVVLVVVLALVAAVTVTAFAAFGGGKSGNDAEPPAGDTVTDGDKDAETPAEKDDDKDADASVKPEEQLPDAAAYIGEYTDPDSDTVGLEIAENPAGGYVVQIGIYRLTSLTDGVGLLTSEGMVFTATDADSNPISGIITVSDGTATVTFTDSTWNYLPNGTAFRYVKTSGTPNLWSEN